MSRPLRAMRLLHRWRWWWLMRFVVRRGTINDYCIACGVYVDAGVPEPSYCRRCGADR